MRSTRAPEVVLLGTGAADGWPSPFCECLSCADMRQAHRVRTPTSALVDGVILLDAGPTVPSAVARAGRSLREVRHVLITHAHPDHLDPALLLWLDWNPTPHTVHLWGPPAVLRACRDWIGPKTPVALHEVAPGDRLDLPTPAGDYRVTVVAARHQGCTPDEIAAEAVLYDVTTPDGGRLLYATDTGPLDGVEAFRGAAYDVILIEETFGDHADHGTGHLDLSTLPVMLERLWDAGACVDTTQVVAVHLGHHNPPEAILRARLADLKERVGEIEDDLHQPLDRDLEDQAIEIADDDAQAGVEQVLQHHRHTTNPIEVAHVEFAARLHVGDVRHPGRDPVEVVEVELHTGLVRDRQQV